MTENKFNKQKIAFIGGALVGLLIFVFIYGVDVICVTNDSLIIDGYIEKDVAQHYAGWMLYRSSPWQFPLGLAQNIAYPYGSTVSYTDSIPLFAMFFKIFNKFLPQTFQYFGIYCLICFMLQGVFGGLLSSLFSSNSLTDLLSSLIFVLSPVMIERAFRHCALTSHFLILAALYYYFRNKRQTNFKAVLPFFIINILAITIHPYFLPFTFGIMFAFCVEMFFMEKKYYLSISYILASIVTSLIVGYITGVFYSTESSGAIGYGSFSMNLNALYNPVSKGFDNWSSVIAIRPQFVWQIEGFNYLGLGIITFIPVAFIVFVFLRKNLLFKDLLFFIKNYFGIIFSTTALTIFAIGNIVRFGGLDLLTINLPDFLIYNVFGVFRASGRFGWLLVYVIMLAVIYILCQTNKKVFTNICLVLLLFIQIFDLKNVLASKHAYFTSQAGDLQGQVYEKILKNSIWDDAAEKYEKCIMISSGISNSGIEIASKFGSNGHAVNTAFEARVDYEKADRLYQETYKMIEDGTLPENTLVMINDIDDKIISDAQINGYSVYCVESDHLVCKSKFSNDELKQYISEGNFEILYQP